MKNNLHSEAIKQIICYPTNESTMESLATLTEQEAFSWETFVKIGSQHLILPLLYHQISEMDFRDQIPSDVVDFLQYTHEMTEERNNIIMEQVKEIIDVLYPKGINILFLKGAANFLDKLYHHPSERVMSDIDFYIEEKDYLETLSVLEKLGYGTLKPKKTVAYGKVKHHDILIREGSPAGLELHFSPVGSLLGQFLPFNGEITSEKKIAAYSNVYCFDDEKKMILNFLQLNFIKLPAKLFSVQLEYGNNHLRKIYDHNLLKRRHFASPKIPGDMGKKFAIFERECESCCLSPKSRISKENLMSDFYSRSLYLAGNGIMTFRKKKYELKKKLILRA